MGEEEPQRGKMAIIIGGDRHVMKDVELVANIASRDKDSTVWIVGFTAPEDECDKWAFPAGSYIKLRMIE
jgi:hypothetical protein